MRVYQLAKELEVQSALILELLDRLGADVKSDLSMLEPAIAELVREKVVVALEAEKKRLAAEHAEQALLQAEVERHQREAAAKAEAETEAAATEPATEPAAEPAAEPVAEPVAELDHGSGLTDAAPTPDTETSPSESGSPRLRIIRRNR